MKMLVRHSVRRRRARSPRALELVSLLPLLSLLTTPAHAARAPKPPGRPPAATPAPSPHRWTDETPDAMIDDALERAMADGAPEADVLAASLVIRSLEPRAENGRAEKALRTIAGKSALAADLAGDIALLARSLADDEGTDAGTDADAALGVVPNIVVLGPFRDTGGGLDTRDGPEEKGGSFADLRRSYEWGTVDVSWRPVPRHYASAAGVPLDLFVSPRTESCTWVASAITLPTPRPIVLRVAASGSVRVLFDGTDVGRRDDVATSGMLDRLAARVEAGGGSHLFAVKVCTGALGDDGHVRLRVTEPSGAPLRLESTADLSTVKSLGAPRAAAPPRAGLPTPLSRVLAPVGAAKGPLLDAAIARTFGGADDSRSPRAPGLLSDLAHRPDDDGDTLALIGWISPSGANRSVVLNEALARAAGVDPRARAFAERRLIAQRMTTHLTDWAMVTSLGAHLGPTDGEAVLLRALLADSLGTDALREAALRDLETFASHQPSLAPTALLRELAHLAATYDPGEARAVREVLGARGYRGHELVDAVGARGADALVAAAKTAFDGNLDDADDGLEVADALSRAGRHDEAGAAYLQMTRWAPNRWEAWSGLAHELSLAGGAAKEPLLAALRRARELAPADASLRAELAFRRQAEAPNAPGQRAHAQEISDATAHDDEKYLVAPEVFLTRRKGSPASGVPDVADRELYWLRAVVLHPDRRVSQLIQYAREVVIPPRTQEDLYEDLPLEGDLTEILRARVYRKDGSTASPTEQHDEGSRPSVRWPELQAGDTVEVVVRTWTRGAVGGRADAPFYFMDYAGAAATHPLLYNEVVVEAPKASPIYLDVLHGDPDRKEERDDGDRHVTRLIWDKPAVIPDEPLAPNQSEIAPLIVGSTFKDWGEFRAWYTGAIQGFTTPDDEVRTLAASLTRGKTTREAKLAALFDFVADDIRYVNFVSGEGWLPNRPQQLLARREGDCDDKAMLLITLLKAIGIEAEEVMVQTRERGQPSTVLAKKAVIPLFDHGIAFLPGPGPGGGQYLDATSPESRLGPLPSMDARAPAFRIQAGPAEMTTLPSSSPTDHGSEVTWAITLHPDGSADLAGEESSIGDAAFWLRSSLTQADARADFVRDHLVEPWLPTVVVDKRVDFKGELPRGAAWVKYSAHASGLARHEGGDLTVSLGQTQGFTGTLASLVTRTLPVVLPPTLAPSHQQRRTRFTAPPGFTWDELPVGGDENGGDFGRAHLEIAKDPADARAVVVKRVVVFDQDVIPAAKYEAWRAWLQRVDRLMHKELRLLAPTRP
jgi:transglutaminase-like putative cysteine protease